MMLSAFVASRACPVHVSGLVIDLSNDDCGNDLLKMEKYLKDPNFSDFMEHCYCYGFVIDKEVPWRLYVDLESEHMTMKMAEFGIDSIEQFYGAYFKEAELAEYLSLIESYAYLYNRLIRDYPSYTIKTRCNGVVSSTVLEREKITLTNRTDTFFAEKERGHNFWLRAYIFSKITEENLNVSQQQMENLVKKAVSMNSALDIQKALMYTNQQLREMEVVPASLMETLRL